MILRYKDLKLVSYDMERENCELHKLYYRWLTDKDVVGWLGRNLVNNYKNQEEFIHKSFDRFTSRECNGFFICMDEKYLGTVKLEIDFENKRGEVGIIIGEKNMWGKGIGMKSIAAILPYAFEKLKLNCVYAGTGGNNIKMQRVFEKLNFKLEGIIRDALLWEGKYIDNYRYSILKNEYKRIQDARM